MTAAPAQGLRTALDALGRVALQAGVAPDSAEAEGAALAAAVAESAPGAAIDWAEQLGDGADVSAFFDAAARGRRWRAAPTLLLSSLAAAGSAHTSDYARALAEVTSAACSLGEPTVRVIGNAAVAAAAQLAASPAPLSVVVAPPAATSPASAAEPVATRPDVDQLLAELDALVGLAEVKREVHRQVALLRMQALRADHGLKAATLTRHLVFTGNPGTGKTTVARLVSGIYSALGLLSRGHLVEVDRSELVAGFLGQTATRTADVVASALGGVLFIDESYSLTGDQYGTEAVDTLVKEMEDHRDDLVVIVAGYPAPMREFVQTNPGLASRFRTTVDFTDYADAELTAIFERLAAAADFEPTTDCVVRFGELLTTVPRDTGFGNGRYARNVLEGAIGRLAWRLREVPAPTRDDLRLLLPQDLDDEPAAPPAPGGTA